MHEQLKQAANAALAAAIERAPHVPGVVAAVTDRKGLVFEGAAGLRRLGASEPMGADAILAIFSCTKAVTAVAALQLLEAGRLELDAPARHYVPKIERLRVIDRFDDGGAPITRPPRRDITIRHLFTHSSGLGYDFINADLLRAARIQPPPGPRAGRRAVMHALLTFDPGEHWQYGMSIDWLGLVVEAISGQPLGDYMRMHIFDPLGMRDTGFQLTPEMHARRASLHARQPDGVLKPLDLAPPPLPEDEMGGGGLYATVSDYARFLRMILDDGKAPDGRILRPETLALATRNALPPGLSVNLPAATLPNLSNDFNFFPGVQKSWGLSFMINDVALETGRPAGALSWAGLGNLYYWIDRQNGVAGIWAAQMFPFVDVAAWPAAQAFEAAVYRGLGARNSSSHRANHANADKGAPE